MLTFSNSISLFKIAFCFLALTGILAATPTDSNYNQTNQSVSLPPGTSNHGNPNLLCTPTKWTDILIFFIGNYIAHVATVKILPGESPYEIALVIVAALCLPISGMLRGLEAILSLAKLAKTEVQMAARAGALCAVVGPKEYFIGARVAHQVILGGPRGAQNQIHGSVSSLPDGYRLAILPWDAEFDIQETNEVSLACSYSLVKILIAIGQATYAIITLYETRGDQIARYGYAAFGLTVAPYAFMSLINLSGNVMCPDYPAIYIVESTGMDNAKKKGLKCTGTIGRLSAKYEKSKLTIRQTPTDDAPEKIKSISFFCACCLGLAVPLATMGGFSRFHRGDSTRTQRGWVMAWVVASITGSRKDSTRLSFNGTEKHRHYRLIFGCTSFCILIYAIPAIGGFVVVGQMLKEYGSCTRL